MRDVVVPLLDVKVCSVLLAHNVDLLEVEQVLVLDHVYCIDFLLECLLLVVLNQFSSLVL